MSQKGPTTGAVSRGTFHHGQLSVKSSVSLCRYELLHFVFLKRRPTWISRINRGRALAHQRWRVEGFLFYWHRCFQLENNLLLLNPSPQVPAKLSGNLEFWTSSNTTSHPYACHRGRHSAGSFLHSMNDSCVKISNISLLKEGPNDLNTWSDVKEMCCFKGMCLPLVV